MKTSRIEWTDHTFNPWWGCSKVSPGCAHCYAKGISRRFSGDIWGKDANRRFFDDPHWQNPVKWNAEALRSGGRYRVFSASMTDVFEDRADLVPHRERLFALIEATPALDWQSLTKPAGEREAARANSKLAA
jgi:protein gp37